MEHIALEVSAIRKLTPDIKLFELVARDGALPPFAAGAQIDIKTGNGLYRPYSLAGFSKH